MSVAASFDFQVAPSINSCEADESDASVVPGVELASLQTSRALSDPPIDRLGMYIKIKAALAANSFKKRARE
ncbi:MAG: hypothetical protein ABJA18_05085 [bacterium]